MHTNSRKQTFLSTQLVLCTYNNSLIYIIILSSNINKMIKV